MHSLADESLIVGGGSLSVVLANTASPQPPQLGHCELVLYTHTPVTACDQVLPMSRSVLTNQSLALPEPDQSEEGTAALYIWAPYGHT